MLQIISGKFYGAGDRHHNDCKAVLYSNVDIYGITNLKHITIQPAGRDGKIYTYVVSYDNQIEDVGSSGFSLVKIGDDEILRQIKILLSFCFNAIFDEEKSVIAKLCRESGGERGDRSVPSAYFSTDLLRPHIAKGHEVNWATQLFSEVIDLQRENYLAVMTCLSAYNAAIWLLDEDVSLAYSMLVFCLESLSQKADRYDPLWEDYNEQKRLQLEKAFNDIPEETATKIKNILLCDEHLKLSKRFLEFVISHVSEEYWTTNAAEIRKAIQRNDFAKAIKNAYNTRSKYAHMLKQADKVLEIAQISKIGDFQCIQNDPHFTISGLFRLSHEVIQNFILSSEKVDTELVDWENQLPGVMTVSLAPQHWVWKIGCAPPHQLSGFLSIMVDKTQTAYPDMRSTLKALEKKFDNLSHVDKQYAYALYLIYNSVMEDSARVDNYDCFLKKNKAILDECCFANIILSVIPLPYHLKIGYELTAVDKCVETYIKNRHKSKKIRLPRSLETIIYIAIANTAKNCNDADCFERYMEEAIYNSCGNYALQSNLQAAKETFSEFDTSDLIESVFYSLYNHSEDAPEQ